MKLERFYIRSFWEGGGSAEQRCGKLEHKFLVSTLIVSHLSDASWDQKIVVDICIRITFLVYLQVHK